MSDAWAVVAAGLGGSALTAAGTWVVGRQGARHDRRQRRREEVRAAYSGLLASSAVVAHHARALHIAMEVRSGLKEGVDLTRKSLDPLDLFEQMRLTLAPLNEAWAQVWTVGSESGIRVANRVITQCAAVMGAATTQGEAGNKFSRMVVGQKWTKEQLDAWTAEERALAAARRDLALLARRELGSEIADVFEPPDSGDGDGRTGAEDQPRHLPPR